MGTHAPQGLSKAAKTWWLEVNRRVELAPHDRHVLSMAAHALTASELADEQITAEGLTVCDRFGQVQPHPLLIQSRQSKALFARLVGSLPLPTGSWGQVTDDIDNDPYDRLSWRTPVRDQP